MKAWMPGLSPDFVSAASRCQLSRSSLHGSLPGGAHKPLRVARGRTEARRLDERAERR